MRGFERTPFLIEVSIFPAQSISPSIISDMRRFVHAGFDGICILIADTIPFRDSIACFDCEPEFQGLAFPNREWEREQRERDHKKRFVQ